MLGKAIPHQVAEESPVASAAIRLRPRTSSGCANGAARPLAITHQGDIVEGPEQKAPHHPAELPADRLPGTEMDRQHPARTR